MSSATLLPAPTIPTIIGAASLQGAALPDRATLADALLWATLTLYTILAFIDFGAGFHYWLAGLHRHGRPQNPTSQRLQKLTDAYLSPVWEITNVFLILFIVGMIGFFPGSIPFYATALLLPLSCAVIVLTLRGAAFAFHHAAPWAEHLLAPIFGLGGLLIPPLLVTFLSASEDGSIRLSANGRIHVSQARLWLSPLHITLALLAISLTIYLSAVFLARYTTQRGDLEVAASYRRAGLRSGLLSAALAFALALALRNAAPDHFAALIALWPLHLLSATLFGVTLWALAYGGRRRSALALRAALAHITLTLPLFGLTRLPWLIHPILRADAALTAPASYTAIMLTLAGGAILIIPALALLYALFIRPPRPAPAPTLAQPAPTASAPSHDSALHTLAHR